MYSCLKMMEQEGNITSYWGDKTMGGRRKYYQITDKGKAAYEENRNNWEYLKRILDNLLK